MTNNSRATRFSGRASLRTITTRKRCFDCGRRSVMAGGVVQLRRTEAGVVGFAGLFTCGAIWLCPVCNAKVMAKRAIEIGVALAWADRAGLKVVFGSLTCWHNSFSPLRPMLDVQRAAWRSVVSASFWRNSNATKQIRHELHDDSCPWVCIFECDTHVDSCEWECTRKTETVQKTDKRGMLMQGRVGYIRAAEISVGVNGWHPHFHPILLIRGSDEYAQWIADDVVDQWVVGVEAAGGEARRDGAQQLKVLKGVEIFDALTGYVTKATFEASKLAMEAAWSQGKTGRGRVAETRSHWSLLTDVENGLADEVQMWTELEKATPFHRMVTWSRGLRDFAGLNDEKTDEEEAAEEVGSRADTVCVISARGWMQVRDAPDVLALLLDALEDGWEQLRGVLDFYGVEYTAAGDVGDLGDPVNAGFADDARSAEENAERNSEHW